MKVLSLFDGISCGMVALERAGIPVERYVAYEIEPNAIKISKKNYPNIEHCGDVTDADFKQYESFDLLIGGSPCQSLSIVQSKTRKHLDGKSKLFFEFVRAKEEMHPKYFLFENVASMNEESKNVISELLGCDPVFIDSKDFSAQERPRYYWTNIPLIKHKNECNKVLKDIMIPAEQIPDKYWYNYPVESIDMTKQVCGTLIHSNHEMHKRIFNPDFKCHTLTCVSGGNQQKKVFQNGRCRKLTPVEYERLQTLPDNYTEGISDVKRYTCCGNGWTVDVIAHIFTCIKNKEEKEKQMELKVKSITFPEAIEFNFEELKKEITEKSETYLNLVYSDKEISEAKKDRANLNKFVKALSDERIRVKKQCLQPFEDFERKINELTGIVNASIKNIDGQIKGYEEQKKSEKLEKINEYWESKEKPFVISLERIMDSKWLNASVSLKSVQAAIDSILDQIEKDLATLQNLPEFGFEATELYKLTLDISKSITEANRLSEMQKRKAEYEAKRKAEEEREKQEAEARKRAALEENRQEADSLLRQEEYIDIPKTNQNQDKQWISFKALLSVDEALALKDFFDSRNIKFESVQLNVEKAAKIMTDTLSYAYCDNCGTEDRFCDECHRKNQNWSLGNNTAETIVKEIAETCL